MDDTSEPGPAGTGVAAEPGPTQDSQPANATGDVGNIGAPAGEASSAQSVEILGRPAQEYLAGLLDNIGTMLAYMNREGIAMPDELRSKLDELMKNPTLDKYSLFSGDKKGKWPWPQVS